MNWIVVVLFTLMGSAAHAANAKDVTNRLDAFVTKFDRRISQTYSQLAKALDLKTSGRTSSVCKAIVARSMVLEQSKAELKPILADLIKLDATPDVLDFNSEFAEIAVTNLAILEELTAQSFNAICESTSVKKDERLSRRKHALLDLDAYYFMDQLSRFETVADHHSQTLRAVFK